MFLLSCGRGSDGAEDVGRDGGRGVERPRVAAAVAPLDERRHSAGDDPWVGTRNELVEGEPPLPFRRLEVAMSNYDSMATRLKTASRTDFPSLWSVGREAAKRKETLTTASGDGEELLIPDQYVGQYQYYCQPQTWSSVFASPGDFTVRIDAVRERNGEVVFVIAVVCSSVRAIKEAPASGNTVATKRKSFVKFVERSERELAKFAETMALKYLGHRLMDKLPKLVLPILTTSQSQLDQHGVAVASYLSYVLSIKAIGYNRLVLLTEPVAKNLFVREFFDLSLGFGDPGMVSTSSCDARLERRAAEDRLLLPSAWFDALDGAHSKSFSHPHRGESPRSEHALRTPPSQHHGGGYDAKATAARQAMQPSSGQGLAGSQSKCTRFVKPSRWEQENIEEGAFTVEITGVAVSDGRAKYTICVLSYVRGQPEISMVDRRFSEFDAMVNRIEIKLRALSIRNHFPTKTLFRYLSVAYLERRAAYLQKFLEKLLQMRFLGVLDQEITMVAEPNVRKFLHLPSVQWSVTPWRIARSPRIPPARGATNRDHMAYASSPTTRTDSSLIYSSSPNSSGTLGAGAYDGEDPSTPSYYDFSRRRSDSM